ncbi:MAG: sulfite exporter TauE/SafE family protein [Armatimonadota bacterium]
MNTANNLPDWLRSLRIIIVILIGFGISILSGLLGIGGGILMVPALIYLLGLNQHKAHGTSLAVISPIVLLTAIYYASHGEVNWLIALELAAGGIIGAGMGARLCQKLSADKLRKYFGLFILLMGIRMLLDLHPAYAPGTTQAANQMISPSNIIGVIAITGIGVITGVLSGLLGIGGGIIMIPALVLLLGASQQLAQGISLAVIIPVSISGAIIHAKHGNVVLKDAVWLAIGGIAGALLGARLAMGMDPLTLRGAFGLLMILMGIWSIIRKPAA